MRIDFYQLSRDPAEKVVAMLAGKVRGLGERLLVVDGSPERLQAASKALWSEKPEAFLANGLATDPHAARQPVLLATDCTTDNGASHAILMDGAWREEASDFARTMLLFDAGQTEAARELWRRLDAVEGADRHIFKQREDGRWREGA